MMAEPTKRNIPQEEGCLYSCTETKTGKVVAVRRERKCPAGVRGNVRPTAIVYQDLDAGAPDFDASGLVERLMELPDIEQVEVTVTTKQVWTR